MTAHWLQQNQDTETEIWNDSSGKYLGRCFHHINAWQIWIAYYGEQLQGTKTFETSQITLKKKDGKGM